MNRILTSVLVGVTLIVMGPVVTRTLAGTPGDAREGTLAAATLPTVGHLLLENVSEEARMALMGTALLALGSVLRKKTS